RILKRKAIVFLISDFFDSGYETALSVAAQKHDVIAITIRDEREDILSDSGVIALENAETGEVFMIDTSSRGLRKKYWIYMQERYNKLSQLFKRNGVDQILLLTGKPYDDALILFFKKRIKQFR
ncbi:DUF58 domain-containing protein, partial [Candidatus Latescibacterota bacterium]